MTTYPVFAIATPVRPSLGGESEGLTAFEDAFQDTYYVDNTLGNDSADGLSPINAFKTLTPINTVIAAWGGARWLNILLKRGEVFSDIALTIATDKIRISSYGSPSAANPRVQRTHQLVGSTWSDFSGTEPGSWQTTYISAQSVTPARLSLDGGTTFLPRAAAIGDVAHEIVGNTWTDLGNNQWSTTQTIGANNRIFEKLSINSAAPTNPKQYQYQVRAAGDWYNSVPPSSATVTIVVYHVGNPNTETSILISGGWFASRSGTTVTVTLFEPRGNPNSNYSSILSSGGTTGLTITSAADQVEINDIDFIAWSTGIDSAGTNVSIRGNKTTPLRIAGSTTSGAQFTTGGHYPLFEDVNLEYIGAQGTQGAYGLKFGSQTDTTPQIKGIILRRTNAKYCGEDGFATDLDESSSLTMDGCGTLDCGENGVDFKRRGSYYLYDCTFRQGIHSQASGTDAAVFQGISYVYAERCNFIVDSAPAGNGAVNFAGAATGKFVSCLLYSNANAALIRGNDTDTYGGGSAAFSQLEIESSLIVSRVLVTASTGRAAIWQRNGNIKLRHCTVGMITALTNHRCLLQQPIGSGDIVYDFTAENCIFYLSAIATSTSSVIFYRLTALTTVTINATACIYFKDNSQGDTSTDWMTDNVTDKTEAEVDTGGALGTGFTLTHATGVTNPTRNPLIANPWGFERSSDARTAAGDWHLDQNLVELDYDGQTAVFTRGRKVTGGTSGAIGWIRNDFDAGATGTLMLSNVTGTFQDDEALTDENGGAAVANGAPTAVTLKLLNFDAQVTNFSTIPQVVTATIGSGHSGLLLSQQDAGTAGDLLLSVASGQTFADNDVVTGASDGSITVNGIALVSPARRIGDVLKPLVKVDFESNSMEWAYFKASPSGATAGNLTADDVGDTLTYGGGGAAVYSLVDDWGFAAGDDIMIDLLHATYDREVVTVSAVTDTVITTSTDLTQAAGPDTNAQLFKTRPVSVGCFRNGPGYGMVGQ